MIANHASIYRIRDYSTHLKKLSESDKYSRFGYIASDSNIDSLILNMCYHPEDHELWFVELDGERVGWGHMSKSDGSSWELAVSVDGDYQRRGIGNLLIVEMLSWAKFHGIQEVFMHCISGNKPIQHLAAKNNLKTKHRTGADVTSSVQLPDPTITETIEQMAKEQRAILSDIGKLSTKLTSVWTTPVFNKSNNKRK